PETARVIEEVAVPVEGDAVATLVARREADPNGSGEPGAEASRAVARSDHAARPVHLPQASGPAFRVADDDPPVVLDRVPDFTGQQGVGGRVVRVLPLRLLLPALLRRLALLAHQICAPITSGAVPTGQRPELGGEGRNREAGVGRYVEIERDEAAEVGGHA